MYRSNHFVSQDDGKAVVGDTSLTNHRPFRQPPLRNVHQNQKTALLTDQQPNDLPANHQRPNDQRPNGVEKNGHPQNNLALAQASPSPFDRSLRLDDRAPNHVGKDMPPALPVLPLNQTPHKDQSSLVQDQVGSLPTHNFRDEQISDLFVAMARASQLPKDQLAQRLQTSVPLLEALEAGALDQLPEWEEISEMILRYTQLIQIDERPILRRLREQLTEYYLTSMSQMKAQLPNHVAEQKHQNAQPQTGSKSTFDPRQPNLDLALRLPEQSSLVQSSPLTSSHVQAPQSFAPTQLEMTRHETASYQRAIPPANFVHANAPQRQETLKSPSDNLAAAFQAPVPVPNGPQKTRGLSRTSKILANIAFILILLFGFIQWQPNRFWSGVDHLPKPIAETIYSVFEMVMPDPFASTFRMNWVHVDDPRMRKADRLFVPEAKKLPKIDFSNLGALDQLP